MVVLHHCPSPTYLHPLLTKMQFWTLIPRHFQSRQPLPASCVRSSTKQYRNCREISPQVQTGAAKKPHMQWWELNSSYFNLLLLIIKYYLWIFMDYNLSQDLHCIWQKQKTKKNTPQQPTTYTEKKPKNNHQPKKQYLFEFTSGNKMEIQGNKEKSLD